MTNMTDDTVPDVDDDPSATPPARGTGWVASKIPLVVTIAVAIVFHGQMDDMEIGSLIEPGPGFWPRILIIAIVLMSLVGFVADLKEGIETFELPGLVRVLGGFAALAAFVLIFENTGMILAGIVFLMLWLKGLNGESWRLSVVLAVVAPLLTYLLFVQALGVRFPEDIVASLWGGR